MTRKDYIVIASAIRETYYQSDEQEQYVVKRVAEKMASALAANNPSFDRITFLKACASA